MIRKVIDNIMAQKQAQRRAELYRNLIREEAKIGGRLFGPIAAGGRREFFCLDEHTWVWHEEWLDNKGRRHSKTTRYDVRPNSILKAQDGHYTHVSPQEARRLYQAATAYRQRVQSELYSFVV